MSLKMEYQSKWNVTEKRMSHKIQCHPNQNVTSKLNITQNGMTLKNERHSKWNDTQNGMTPNRKCHLNVM